MEKWRSERSSGLSKASQLVSGKEDSRLGPPSFTPVMNTYRYLLHTIVQSTAGNSSRHETGSLLLLLQSNAESQVHCVTEMRRELEETLFI